MHAPLLRSQVVNGQACALKHVLIIQFTSTLVDVCSHSTPVARHTALPDFGMCEAKTMAALTSTLFSAWVHMLQMSISAERKQVSTFQLGWSGHPAPCGA